MRVGLTFERKSDFVPPPGAPKDVAAEMEMDYTIDELAEAIEADGHRCVLLGDARRLLPRLADLAKEVDLVFNYSVGYGARARETWVPALLDLAGVPYVGGDAVCLGIATDKLATKALARELGVRVPAGGVVFPGGPLPADVPFPAMVKPAYEGSSIGIGDDARVETEEECRRVVERVTRTYRQPVLVEEFIDGFEATVCLLGEPLEPYGVVGVRIDDDPNMGPRFLSNTIKGAHPRVMGVSPSDLPRETERRMGVAAATVARALGAKDFCRCDFRVTQEGEPVFLEANPIPQLQRIKGEFTLCAEARGETFHDAVARILRGALARHGLTPGATA
jgi:D-alanine-D-alanine ligase